MASVLCDRRNLDHDCFPSQRYRACGISPALLIMRFYEAPASRAILVSKLSSKFSIWSVRKKEEKGKKGRYRGSV